MLYNTIYIICNYNFITIALFYSTFKADLLWKKKQKVPRKIVDAAIGLFYNTKEYANY